MTDLVESDPEDDFCDFVEPSAGAGVAGGINNTDQCNEYDQDINGHDKDTAPSSPSETSGCDGYESAEEMVHEQYAAANSDDPFAAFATTSPPEAPALANSDAFASLAVVEDKEEHGSSKETGKFSAFATNGSTSIFYSNTTTRNSDALATTAAPEDGAVEPQDICDYDAAPSEAGDLVNATPPPQLQQYDDPFGSQAAAPTTEIPSTLVPDDAESSLAVNLTAPEVDTRSGSGLDEAPKTEEHDSFGGFDSSTPQTQSVTPVINDTVAHVVGGDAVVTATQEEQDDSFGGFDSAAPQTTADTPIEPAADGIAVAVVTTGGQDDSFGGFESAPQSEIASAASDPDSNPLTVANDDYGGFDAAPQSANAVTEPEACKVVVAESPEVQDDSFGGFDSAAPQSSNSGKAAAASTEADDSFGDFDDAAPEIGTPDPILAAVGDAAAEEPDDNFGDFDAASPQTADDADAAGVEEENAGRGFEPAPEFVTATDDFGDFDAASPVDEELPVVATTTDFGDSDAAAPRSLTPATEDDDGDDFGDFDEAPAATTPQIEEDDDDDFGDFDAAPAVQAPTEEVDEDDDFGDFDEAPTETADATPAAAASLEPRVDPILANARSVFPNLFAKYSSHDRQNEEDDDDSSPADNDAVTVASVLAPIHDVVDAKAETDESGQSASVLKKLFQGDENVVKSARSKVIVAHGARGPFWYTNYPVGGGCLETAQTRRSETRTNICSLDVLPIQLPSAEIASVGDNGASSNVPVAARQPTVELTETVVELPPRTRAVDKRHSAEATRGDGSDDPSDRVKEFLKKIPDLSFMLSSKLSLPQK